MLQYDFEESIGYWIFSTAHVLTQTLNEQLAAHDITYRQWEVLVFLAWAGEMTQSELAAQLRIEAPTLAGVLDRMERDGWIQRHADPQDRRRKIVSPTERVEPVWAKMVACAREVRARATAGLDDETLATVRDALARVRQNLTSGGEPGQVNDPSGVDSADSRATD